MLTLYKEEEKTTIKENIKLFLESIQERETHTLWFVLEPARDEAIQFFLDEHEDVSHYLFHDEDEDLQEAGAVALCLHDVPEVLEWIIEHWGKGWFSFFVTTHSEEEVIAHMSSLCYLSSHAPSLSLKVVYSLLTNSIARVHIYPTWFFSVKDKEEWDIDQDALIYEKLSSILQKSANILHPIIRSGETAPKSGIYQAYLPPDHSDAQKVHANPASSRLCMEGIEMSPLGLNPEMEDEIRWEWVRE